MRNSGFTLVELIVTMSVLSIVLGIAVFSFKDVIWRNQVNTAANDLVTALNYARSEAVTRGQTVTICRSTNSDAADDPSVPVPSCSTAAGAGWETGYIVFVDTDGDGVRDKDEALLRTFAGARGGVTMVGNNNVANRASYAATGFSPGVSSGTVKITNSGKTLRVILSNNGRVRTESP